MHLNELGEKHLHALAGWTRAMLFPLLQRPMTSGRFEFLFSPLLALSVVPAFFVGLINGKLRAEFATSPWILPSAILLYKLLTFSMRVSVLQSQSLPALHYYLEADS